MKPYSTSVFIACDAIRQAKRPMDIIEERLLYQTSSDVFSGILYESSLLHACGAVSYQRSGHMHVGQWGYTGTHLIRAQQPQAITY